MLDAETAVVCLQNGVDATDIVARLHGRGRVVGGVVMINAEITAPGIIRHNALNRLTVGELDGRSTARLERFVALSAKAGIETAVSGDIRLEIWRKFLLLAPMSALSALTRVELARIRQHEETWRLAEQGMREVVAVANAEGVGLTEEDVRRTLAFVQGMPPTWRASLAVDLEQGTGSRSTGSPGPSAGSGEPRGSRRPFTASPSGR